MKFLLLFSYLHFLHLYAQVIIPVHTTQLIVVKADNFKTTQAQLQAYEKVNQVWVKKGKKIIVNLGRTGLAWGEGLQAFKHSLDEPIKHEGDGKSPAGLFSLDSFFGYENFNFNFPYLQVNKQSICIDDSDSAYYNTLIQTTDPKQFKSYEKMRREDSLYKLGIVVGHNTQQQKAKGSCIFLHIQRDKDSSTAGCTSMQEEELLKLMLWLDKEKNPLLLQLPQIYLKNFP